MRKSVKEFVRICSENLVINEPIYEFGSMQVEGQIGFADLRPYFVGKNYTGSDMMPGIGVDIILNLHDLNLEDKSVGTAILIDTIEHVEYVRKAISEVCRVLKDDGILLVSGATLFHIHGYPNDYWRFTPEGIRSLLKDFSQVYIEHTGFENNPHVIVGIGFKKPFYLPNRFLEEMKNWKIRFKDKTNDRSE